MPDTWFLRVFGKKYDAQILDDCGLGVDLLNSPMPLFEFLCADCEKPANCSCARAIGVMKNA
jgi:hypothetical protein